MRNGVVGATLGYPASEAVHLLLQHVHGGLHNAAMALQLSAEASADGNDDDPRLVAQSGLEGIARAARGMALLTVTLGLKAGPGAAPADHQWVALVESLLRSRAQQRHVELDVEGTAEGASTSALDPERLVAMLLQGIEAIDAAASGSCVNVSTRADRELTPSSSSAA